MTSVDSLDKHVAIVVVSLQLCLLNQLFHLNFAVITETPRFIGEMKKKTAKVGGSVVFECIASGSPAPTFVWLKDNKVLNETARFISTSTGQLCIIVRVQRKDAGVYACRVSNTLGAVTQRAHLTVIDGKCLDMSVVAAVGLMTYLATSKQKLKQSRNI